MALGVSGAFSNINTIQRLNAEELRLGISGEASWHYQYKNSCYIYISGLDPRLTEGDVAIVFSQWGEPIDVVLVRDQKTGIPRGFGFLGYEDQRSTILAVDNANGMKLLQRTLRVDHCKDFRPPTSGKNGDKGEPYQPTGAEGAGIGKHLVTKREKELHKSREQQRKLQQQRRQQAMASAAAGSKDVDEMWAEEFEMMLSNLNAEADAEVDALIKEDKRLKKKLKKEKKLLKKSAKNRNSSSSKSHSRSRSRSRLRYGDKEKDGNEKESSSRADHSSAKIEESSGRSDHHSRPKEESSTTKEQHSSSRRDDSSSKRDHHSRKESSSKSMKDRHTRSRERTGSSKDPRERSRERGRERNKTNRGSRSTGRTDEISRRYATQGVAV